MREGRFSPVALMESTLAGIEASEPKLQVLGDPVFQTPWTFVGVPSITVPSGIVADGLPLGLQLITAPFAEARLLAVTRWCERTLGFAARPTLYQTH